MIVAGTTEQPCIQLDRTGDLDMVVAIVAVNDEMAGGPEDALGNPVDTDGNASAATLRSDDDVVITGGPANHEGGLTRIAGIRLQSDDSDCYGLGNGTKGTVIITDAECDDIATLGRIDM